MPTRIWLCGRLRVSLDGESLEHRLERRQARALAALLVLRRERPMRREELIEAIWPQSSWGQHEGALRVLLSAVRRVFGTDALTGRVELRLELPSDVWIDVEQAAAVGTVDRRRSARPRRSRRECARARGGSRASAREPEGGRAGGPGSRHPCPLPRGELHGRLLSGAESVSASPPADAPALDAPRLPLPAALAPVERARFVGREGELGTLDEAWRAARTGARRVTLIAGEPGIGKTSLVSELARRAERDGAVMLYGRCDEDVGFAFQPFVEALSAYVAACPAPLLRELAGRGAPELARVLPELAELLGDVTPPARPDAALDQYRMFEAVVGFLAAVAARAPLLLVLDDLHWAARPTLHLLRHLVRSPPNMAVYVVGTFRDTELPSASIARRAAPADGDARRPAPGARDRASRARGPERGGCRVPADGGHRRRARSQTPLARSRRP